MNNTLYSQLTIFSLSTTKTTRPSLQHAKTQLKLRLSKTASRLTQDYDKTKI